MIPDLYAAIATHRAFLAAHDAKGMPVGDIPPEWHRAMSVILDAAPGLVAERNTLIDAIMPNPKGVEDALAYLEGEREFARSVQADRDHLAGTVELCCLPVDGEAHLADRIRAAGDAQRELQRMRGADANRCPICEFGDPVLDDKAYRWSCGHFINRQVAP